ncbi:hypothetical protein [Ornithinibacillus californiensis]|uniref:hypothetical protein n=1 Tax=Ornithinibacillus californiensis TaxID=161536 RepID=UPI00064DE034|nr:hypothetical protein [Ornithinibacillus californiensis]
MAQVNMHEKLQQASKMLKEAQQAVIQAQGQDIQTVERAHELLNQAESELQNLQNQAGREAIENSQFQQAFESLHDIRQQAQEAAQNIRDEL